jgi:hypothetical protein
LGVEDLPANALLADAFVAACAHEMLRVISPNGVLPVSILDVPLVALALAWLREEDLATQTEHGWLIAAESELPPAIDIWRSLFFGSASASAECALLATLGPSLAAGDAARLLLPPVLREQALSASPSARNATAMLLRGLAAFTTAWPTGRCLRVAVVGTPQSTLVRRVLNQIEAAGLPLRFVVLSTDPDALNVMQGELSGIPGASAQLWSKLPDDMLHCFDIVLDLFGLSLPGRERLPMGQLLELLTPAGLLLAAEPMPNRVASLLFGPAIEAGGTAMLQSPEAWCLDLRHAGFAEARHTLLDGAIWPVALMVASADSHSFEDMKTERRDGLVLFAAPNDPLAAAVAARQAVLRQLPIEALREVLTAPFAAQHQHVLLLAEDLTEDDAGPEALAELLADISCWQ